MASAITAIAAAHHVRSATLADDSDLEFPRSEGDSTHSSSGHDASSSLPLAVTAAAILPGTPQQLIASPCSAETVHAQCKASNGGGKPGLQSSLSFAAASSSRDGAVEARTPTGREHRRNFSGDPDYEVPEGTMTETQVLKLQQQEHGSVYLDRYGFLVPDPATASTSGGGAASSSSDARSLADRERDERHVRKWRKMLGSGGASFSTYMARRPLKVKRRVRKGIPEELRGLAWQLLSGGRELLLSNPGRFALLQQGVTLENDTAIMRDLNRTFPNHILFMQRQGMGQRSLYHVLRAYAAYDSQVGYVQGMGFVVAVLLMYMTEEEAFWTLVALMHGGPHPPLEGLYTFGMPTLRQCLYQFQALLQEELPAVAVHFTEEGLDPALYATCWFNTIFAYTLPAGALMRVWDIFMLEGMRVVFRVGLALLKLSEPKLLAAGFEGLAAMLSAKALPALVPPPDELLKVALKISLTKRLQRIKIEYDVHDRQQQQNQLERQQQQEKQQRQRQLQQELEEQHKQQHEQTAVHDQPLVPPTLMQQWPPLPQSTSQQSTPRLLPPQPLPCPQPQQV